jgi:hypothetical protein
MAAEFTESICARAEKHRAVVRAGPSKPAQIRALFRIDGCTNRENLPHSGKEDAKRILVGQGALPQSILVCGCYRPYAVNTDKTAFRNSRNEHHNEV